MGGGGGGGGESKLKGVMLILCPPFQMVGLYSDPNGEDIFKRSTVDSNSAGVSKFTYSESDMLGLRKRIKELEDEVKETHVSKTLLE